MYLLFIKSIKKSAIADSLPSVIKIDC